MSIPIYLSIYPSIYLSIHPSTYTLKEWWVFNAQNLGVVSHHLNNLVHEVQVVHPVWRAVCIEGCSLLFVHTPPSLIHFGLHTLLCSTITVLDNDSKLTRMDSLSLCPDFISWGGVWWLVSVESAGCDYLMQSYSNHPWQCSHDIAQLACSN